MMVQYAPDLGGQALRFLLLLVDILILLCLHLYCWHTHCTCLTRIGMGLGWEVTTEMAFRDFGLSIGKPFSQVS